MVELAQPLLFTKAITASAMPVAVAMLPIELAELDLWAWNNGKLSRSEAARRLINRGMGETSTLTRVEQSAANGRGTAVCKPLKLLVAILRKKMAW